MTKEQLGKNFTCTISKWVSKMLGKFQVCEARYGAAEARKMWREKYGLIYQQEYTVSARFRWYMKTPWDDLPAVSQKTLEKQRLLKQSTKGGMRRKTKTEAKTKSQ